MVQPREGSDKGLIAQLRITIELDGVKVERGARIDPRMIRQLSREGWREGEKGEIQPWEASSD